jgi:hypothetical protein
MIMELDAPTVDISCSHASPVGGRARKVGEQGTMHSEGRRMDGM